MGELVNKMTDPTQTKLFHIRRQEGEKQGKLFLDQNDEDAMLEQMMKFGVHSRNNKLVIEMLGSAEEEHRLSLFERAVLFCTLNDDPETLEAVLEWGAEKYTIDKENCSILISSLENYNQ